MYFCFVVYFIDTVKIYFVQEEILLTLLKYRANVNVSDSSGASPLHYAASHKDSLVFLKILLSVGHANPTMR